MAAKVTTTATILSYPQSLLVAAKALIDDGQYSIAIVVVHMACEIGVERRLSSAFAAKGIQYLEDAIGELLSGYNLANDRIRKLYAALSGEKVEEESFWNEFKASAKLRNEIIHSGAMANQNQAERAHRVHSRSCAGFFRVA